MRIEVIERSEREALLFFPVARSLVDAGRKGLRKVEKTLLIPSFYHLQPLFFLEKRKVSKKRKLVNCNIVRRYHI
jgi:hypothetical protein